MPSSSNSTTIKAGGTATVLTNEATTKVTANTVYQITDATKRVLDPDTALVVEVDADGGGGGGYATAAVGTYTVDYMFGKITFASDQGASALVRVSGKYIPTLAVAEGTEFELDDAANLLESTVFGDGWRKRFTGLQEASGSFTLIALLQTDLDPGAGERKLRTAMRSGTKLLLEYRPGGAADYWRAWVYLSQEGEKGQVDGRLEGTVQFSTHAPTGVGEGELAVPTWGAG
jgi:hypothetical protein